MGLKCSVIGHRYGDAAVEREREEQGSEVVITIQERETCERCGKTRIVSENKEVTAIETPSDIAGDMLDEGAEDAGAEADEPDDEGGSDTEVSAAAAGESGPAETGETHEAVDDSAVGAVDPDADDAEILDDGAAASGDSELENPSTEVSIADAESEPSFDADEATTQDPESDDGHIIDADEEESQSVRDDREPGEWPAEPGEEDDDWAPETAAADADEESSDVEPFGGSAVTVPSGQFRCPKCEFTTDVASSSLRAGDFCPECHRGALVHTEDPGPGE